METPFYLNFSHEIARIFTNNKCNFSISQGAKRFLKGRYLYLLHDATR